MRDNASSVARRPMHLREPSTAASSFRSRKVVESRRNHALDDCLKNAATCLFIVRPLQGPFRAEHSRALIDDAKPSFA